MPKPSELPHPFRSQPFLVGEALGAGITPGRLRASDLVRTFHGTRSHETPQTIEQMCLAYSPKLRGKGFFSHATAAILYRMPLSASLERSGELHVSVLAPAHPPRARNVTGHRLPPHTPVRSHRGHRVVSPEYAWYQLAGLMPIDDLVVAGDHLIRRKQPLCRLEELNSFVQGATGRGIRPLRAALALLREGTDSPMESRLRLAIVRSGLPEPVVGHTVRDPMGGFIATPDLAYVKHRIAIEYEGDVHRVSRRTFVEDIARREALEDAGWRVIRVVSDHLGPALPLLIARIRRALAA